METKTKIQTLNRFSPFRLNSEYSLKNRVIVPPMASGTADANGMVTTKTIEHYLKLSQAEASLVIVEYTFVHASGRSEENQLGISSDEHIKGLSEIAHAIHSSGALAGIQITHSGGKSSRDLTNGQLMGASSIPVPVKGQELEAPATMSLADIELWKNSFAKAIQRAVAAGFDLVEFHSAHGYGLNQWLSPITNKREDEYGQNLIGRSRLLREVVTSARQNHPKLLLSVRMPGQDFFPGGLSITDTLEVAKMLESLGVNILHISSGIGGWRRPADRVGQGYLVDEAAYIQASVSIPVVGVGGIESGNYIDQSLQSRRFSLAAVGRAILSDPIAWKNSQMKELNCL